MRAVIEQFAASEVRADPDQGVLLLRDRPNDAEAFFVFEGELTYRFGEDEQRVESETWVFVPSAVTYTLHVTGAAPARFLHVRVPGSSAREVVVRRTGGAEGEAITDRPNRRATLLVDTDELTISEFSYGAGERGAKLHVHRRHADAFFVVEGELALKLHEGVLAVPAGTFVLIPPNVVHGFDNDSAANMRCFNFHAPSLGFGDYLRGQNPEFDQHDPPADGGADPSSIVAVRLAG